MIYNKNTLNVPMTPAACGGSGSFVKRSENWGHPIPSIGLGRHTTTTESIQVLTDISQKCGPSINKINICILIYNNKNQPTQIEDIPVTSSCVYLGVNAQN